MNQKYTIKYRKVLTLIDAVSQTGGIIGVLAGLGVIINNLFASTIFKLKIIKKMYRKSA